MMKKQFNEFSLSVVGILLLLLLGCTSETSQELSPVEGGAHSASSVSFFFRFPSEDPVLFSTRSEIQTASEKSISRLDIYQFAELGGEQVLEQMYLKEDFATVGDGASLTLKVKGSGNKTFVFVANNTGTGKVSTILAPSLGMKLEDFKRQVTESTDGSLLVSPLLMVGSKEIEVLESGTPNQSVELTRIMARLDIKNYEPHLTLKRVRLENVPDRSYVMHVGDASTSQNVPGAKVINLPEVELPTEPTAAGADPAVVLESVPESLAGGVVTEAAHQHYKHVYYPYVSDVVTEASKAPVLVIEGTLFAGHPDREHDVVYYKELKLDGVTGEEYLGFKRNHRYTVAIKGGTIPGKVDIELYVNKWNLVELPMEEIEVEAPRIGHVGFLRHQLEGDAILIDGHYIHSAILTTAYHEWLLEERYSPLFGVVRNADWEILIEGENTPIPAEGEQVTSWLKVKPYVNSYWINIVPNHTFPSDFRLVFTEANTTGVDRSVTLILRSKADPSKFSRFKVTQSHKDKVLERDYQE